MSKRKKKNRKINAELGDAASEAASNELVLHPEATVTPYSEEQDSTNILPRGDSTSADNLIDDDDVAQTSAALIDKHLFGKRKIPFTTLLIFICILSGLVFYSDNVQGLLKDTNAIIWTIKKCLMISGFFGIIWLLHRISKWFGRK